MLMFVNIYNLCLFIKLSNAYQKLCYTHLNAHMKLRNFKRLLILEVTEGNERLISISLRLKAAFSYLIKWAKFFCLVGSR